MAAMDFMHKQLISAAGRDALTSMGAGAGIGAGVGAANALVTGNDSLLGGATSGAMLGAGAGAAMRYAGAKYGSGLMAGAKAGDDTSKFSTTFFTKATKDDDILSFMGSAEDAGKMKGFAEAAANQAAAKAASKGGAANAAGTPTAGAVKTSSGPEGTTPGRLKAQQDAQAAFGQGNTPENRHGDAQAAWEAKKAAYAREKAEQAKNQVYADAKNQRNESIKALGFGRAKAREQSIDRRQQRRFESQVADDIRSVNGDLSRMGNFPYTPSEIAAGFKKTGKTVDEWAKTKPSQQPVVQQAAPAMLPQENKINGLSNTGAPSASLNDVFKYMNGG